VETDSQNSGTSAGGGDWNCLMSWQDPQVPMPVEGYGKFELNVHANNCYTATGPTKLTGYLTITNAAGKDVTNPLFEFDGCFDSDGDTNPTGVSFPSTLAVTSTSLDLSGDRVYPQFSCSLGAEGCAGTVTATGVDGQPLGTATYDLEEGRSVKLAFASPRQGKVTLTIAPTKGAAVPPVTVSAS
jgi:hypothetical protein